MDVLTKSDDSALELKFYPIIPNVVNVSDLKVQYGDSSNFIYFYKWNQHWGPGINSLTISGKIPAFPHYGFSWDVTEEIHFNYFHGQFISAIEDTTYSDYYSLNEYHKPFQISRNISGHRLDWQLSEKWNISISELVIYANRSLEVAYLLPFIPFFPIQNYIGDIDKIIDKKIKNSFNEEF